MLSNISINFNDKDPGNANTDLFISPWNSMGITVYTPWLVHFNDTSSDNFKTPHAERIFVSATGAPFLFLPQPMFKYEKIGMWALSVLASMIDFHCYTDCIHSCDPGQSGLTLHEVWPHSRRRSLLPNISSWPPFGGDLSPMIATLELEEKMSAQPWEHNSSQRTVGAC